MQLVKKTQKDWECKQCFTKIPTASSMCRDNISKWRTDVFCLSCAKEEVEEKVKIWTEIVRTFKYPSDDPMSGYMIMKSNKDHYENLLANINIRLVN